MNRLENSTLSRVETTIGELIETITEIALESGKSEHEGYRLAALTIEKILREQQEEVGVLIQ